MPFFSELFLWMWIHWLYIMYMHTACICTDILNKILDLTYNNLEFVFFPHLSNVSQIVLILTFLTCISYSKLVTLWPTRATYIQLSGLPPSTIHTVLYYSQHFNLTLFLPPPSSSLLILHMFKIVYIF